MPHGAGGHVGGHHHHGGGFNHHRHHSHWRHHHTVHTGYAYGRGVYYRRRPATVCSVFGCSIVGVFITLAVIFSIRFTYVGEASGMVETYAPNDTRLLSYSDVFCDSLYIQTDQATDEDMSAHLLILDEQPTLTDHDSFAVSELLEVPTSDSYSEYVSFYLYSGSSIHTAACLPDGATYYPTFYLIRGTDNFNSWTYDLSPVHTIAHFDVNTNCADGNNTFPYAVTTQGEYFLVYYNEHYLSDSVNVQFTYDFFRTKYSVNDSFPIRSCSISLSSYVSCQLALDFDSGHSALLVVDQSNFDDWTQNINISISCGARIWIYAVISAAVLVGACALLTTIIVTCVCIYKRRQKRYAPLADTTATAEAAELPKEDAVNPPPYNPTYGQANYGSTAPPPYAPK